MRPITKRIFIIALALFAVICSIPTLASAQVLKGSLPDGATYIIEVPPNWNGTLLLYSHGYVTPFLPGPAGVIEVPLVQAPDAGDPATRGQLLQHGFALAGSSYSSNGWAIEDALRDQIAVLDIFDASFPKPTATIAWGHSLGGIITAGLIQNNPTRFDAALPMCGVLSGGVATWNQALDSAFAFKTLLAPGSPLAVTNIGNNDLLALLNFGTSLGILQQAQQTPQGRARLALSTALGDTPGWFDPGAPEPAADDFASQELNQFKWAAKVDFIFIFAFREELERRAGGNPSWNTGVDYRKQFEKSVDKAEVMALYNEAGLSLEDDLETLNKAARISADPNAVNYVEKNIVFNGEIHIPVLSMHTEGDGLVSNQNENAYRHTVDEAGNQRFLRQIFVHRAGHCAFSPAETLTAVDNLVERLKTGHWPDLHPGTLNATAAAFGPLNVVVDANGNVVPSTPSFDLFHPAKFERPFDAFDALRCARDPDSDGGVCNAF